jgi:CotH kinase protein/Secretion system C-terminal sorting domain
MKRYFGCLLILLSGFYLRAQPITSSNLPIIVINTNGQQILDDPKVMADMGIINNTAGQRNNFTDAFNEYNGKIGIEIRGQSSQQFPMKSYSIELWDNAGAGVNKSLFGLPSESDWVLYAPYNEKTLMHNFLAYTISRQLDRWAANCRYVELVLNGEYVGIYLLMEKIKRNDGRVKISKIGKTDISGDKLTGGYIFSIDKQADGWFSAYNAGAFLNAPVQYSYVYPKLSSIVQEQKDYIKSYVDSFETSLKSSGYQDTVSGWRHFADESSFIDYFLVNEVSRNVDGYRLSSYFYKDKNSVNRKIMAGPAWDYDLAFKNADYCNGSDTSGWAWEFNNVCSGDFWQVPFWWGKFKTDTTFQNDLLCRWKQLRQTTLSQQNLYNLIDSVASLTSEARERHFAKWPVLGQYVWPNPQPIAATYEEEIIQLKSWLSSRIRWIDKNLSNVGKCAVIIPEPVTNSASIYPNPIVNNTTVKISSVSKQVMHLQVYDMGGRTLVFDSYQLAQGENSITINTASWAKGIYTFRFVMDTGERFTNRVMKK